MKKAILMILAVCLLLSAMPLGVLATETAETEQAELGAANQCGENLTWSYAGGTLTVSGAGTMNDYQEGMEPWREYKDSITKVVFTGGVTYVGTCAFKDYDYLSAVEFGDAMHTVGEQAFMGCDILQSIILPASFRCFGKECFMGCKQLLEVWCRGGMPSFKGNCLWDTGATVYYPPNNAWPVDAVWQVLSSYRNRIMIQGGYAPEPETTAETEPVATEAAATEAAVTEPAETEAATEPVETVPETTAPETTAATEPVQTVPAETEQQPTLPDWLQETEETEPEQESETEKKAPVRGKGVVVFGAILGGVVLFFLLGALIFRRRRY